eukprot:9564397-Lingulodinium_polyedra.AAC.1
MQHSMRRCPRDMPPAEIQRYVDSTIAAFQHRATAQIPWTPKWHLMLHIAARVRTAGNPRFYS